MKKLILILILLSSFHSIGQADPELFRTWHLNYLLATDMATPYEIAEINPPIYPFIIISEHTDPEILEINGQGACNTFEGTYTYIASNNEFYSIDFNNTKEDCGVQIYNSFESDFFIFIKGGWYEITTDNQGKTLTISNPLMGYAILKDYPLSVTKNEKLEVRIFPNPVSEKLYITSKNDAILKVSLYSINGQLIFSKNQNLESIDVSALSKGIYFIEVISCEGVKIQKLVKN